MISINMNKKSDKKSYNIYSLILGKHIQRKKNFFHNYFVHFHYHLEKGKNINENYSKLIILRHSLLFSTLSLFSILYSEIF